MDLIKGVIEKILWKDTGEEDQFGNTHRLSMKIGDVWVGFGKKKANKRGELKVSIKKGTGWEDIEEGDEIALVTSESNGYLNGKTSDIKVVKKQATAGTGADSSAEPKSTSTSSVPSQAVPRAPAATSGVDRAAKDAGAAASASIDKALAYFTLAGFTTIGLDDILVKAREFQGLVKILAHEIQSAPPFQPPVQDSLGNSDGGSPRGPLTSGMPGKTAQSRTTKAKPAPVEPDESDFADDEDIPF